MAREILGKEKRTRRGLRLNIDCEGLWRMETININRYMVPLPKGFDFLRAEYSDLEHYFELESVEEIWLNKDLPVEPAMKLLKVGGRLHLFDEEVVIKVGAS